MRWLGFDWGEHLYHASDYFERLYEWAEYLIRAGKAYVDDQTQEEMRLTRGTLTEAGTESPYRGRSVEENLDLFRRMRAGEFPNGARVLRAKIDMASGNINLRDPVLYRILHAEHPRTGTAWCIYPSYDFAHGQSDAIEGITHSICTLEFEDHRPLYDWFLDNLPVPSRPHQYEFARLNLTYTVLSKRVLTELVRGGHVGGWDDPRMPTLAGLAPARRAAGRDPRFRQAHRRRQGEQRRRCRHAGIFHPRASQQDGAAAHGGAAAAENRHRELSRGPKRGGRGGQSSRGRQRRHAAPAFRPRAFHRARRLYGKPAEEILPPGAGPRGAAALRLFHHLPRGGEGSRPARWSSCAAPTIRRPAAATRRTAARCKATLHWVSAADAVPAEVRLYNPLFLRPDPNAANFAADLNPNSLEVIAEARVEPSLADAKLREAVQFERQGYFCRDAGFHARPARLQPHGRTARQLGQGRRRQQIGRVLATGAGMTIQPR